MYCTGDPRSQYAERSRYSGSHVLSQDIASPSIKSAPFSAIRLRKLIHLTFLDHGLRLVLPRLHEIGLREEVLKSVAALVLVVQTGEEDGVEESRTVHPSVGGDTQADQLIHIAVRRMAD